MKYKLTDRNGRTYGDTQWGPGVRHAAVGKGSDLCSDGWIHFYDDPLLAVLLNTIGADYHDAQLWEFQPEGEQKHDRGVKSGSKAGTTLREIPLPLITPEQRIRFGILAAWEVRANWDSAEWCRWAKDWLAGRDCAEVQAHDAAYHTAKAAAAYAASNAAARAASAASAAYTAVCAAYAITLADVAGYAAYAAAAAAASAASAVAAADATEASSINLAQLAKQAMQEVS